MEKLYALIYLEGRKKWGNDCFKIFGTEDVLSTEFHNATKKYRKAEDDCPNIFWMEEKNGKLILIAKIFGSEEVLKTQFHHAKETKNAEIDALIYLGRRKS